MCVCRFRFKWVWTQFSLPHTFCSVFLSLLASLCLWLRAHSVSTQLTLACCRSVVCVCWFILSLSALLVFSLMDVEVTSCTWHENCCLFLEDTIIRSYSLFFLIVGFIPKSLRPQTAQLSLWRQKALFMSLGSHEPMVALQSRPFAWSTRSRGKVATGSSRPIISHHLNCLWKCATWNQVRLHQDSHGLIPRPII